MEDNKRILKEGEGRRWYMMVNWGSKSMRLIYLVIGFAIFFVILKLVGLKPVSIIDAGLFAMTPLALAAIGEVLNEKAGTVNIGLDGILLLSATIGVYGAEVFNNGYMGLLTGLAVGGLVGLILGLISVYLRADQIIAGMGINMFAYGFVPYMLLAVWGMPGIHIPPSNVLVPTPTIGPSFRISEITIITILLAFIAHFIIYKTPIGLRIRAAGEAPEALDVAGIRVDIIRVVFCTIGGALAGLGGAFMSLAWFGGIVKELSAGRGFIALACVVASGLEPLLALGFAFLFGFTESLAYSIAITPGVKQVVPYHLVLMIPYIVTLVIVTIFIGRKRFPRALGIPYVKE